MIEFQFFAIWSPHASTCVQRSAAFFRGVVRNRKQHLLLTVDDLPLKLGDDIGKERIREVRDDQTEDVASSRLERRARAVGNVVCRRDDAAWQLPKGTKPV